MILRITLRSKIQRVLNRLHITDQVLPHLQQRLQQLHRILTPNDHIVRFLRYIRGRGNTRIASLHDVVLSQRELRVAHGEQPLYVLQVHLLGFDDEVQAEEVVRGCVAVVCHVVLKFGFRLRFTVGSGWAVGDVAGYIYRVASSRTALYCG